jgi:hypothetical protein
MTACSFEPGTLFGELEIVGLHRTDKQSERIWECICLACGKRVYRSSGRLNQAAKKGHVQCCLNCSRQKRRGEFEARLTEKQKKLKEMWEQYGSLYGRGYYTAIESLLLEDLISEFGPVRDPEEDARETNKYYEYCDRKWLLSSSQPPTSTEPRSTTLSYWLNRYPVAAPKPKPKPKPVLDAVKIQKYRHWPKDEKHLQHWAGRARIVDALIDVGIIEHRTDETRLISTEDLAHTLADFLKYFAQTPHKNEESKPSPAPARKPRWGPSIYPNSVWEKYVMPYQSKERG